MLSKDFARNFLFCKDASMENNVDRTHIVTKMMDMSPRKEFKAHVHVSDGHLHFHSLLKKAGNAAVATSRFFKDPIFQPEIAHFQYFIFLSTLGMQDVWRWNKGPFRFRKQSRAV